MITPQSESLQTAGLFKHEPSGRDLLVSIDADLNLLTATLSGPDQEASGRSEASLTKPSPYTTTLRATVVLNGYDANAEEYRHLEAAISAAWILSRSDGVSLELAGAALVTDLDDDSLASFGAVRYHPGNQLNPMFAAPTPAAGQPGSPIVDLRSTGGPNPGPDNPGPASRGPASRGAGGLWRAATSRARRGPRQL